MGNFFPMMICGLFGVFWLSFGMLQLPTLGLAASYSVSGADAAAGAATKEFNAVIAVYLIVWGFAILTFWIFTLKINAVFSLKLLLATIAAFVLSGSYWKLSIGDHDQAQKLLKVSDPLAEVGETLYQALTAWQAGGGILFVVGFLAWYLLFVMMAAEMRLPINLPVGDLSHFWPKTDVEMGDVERHT